jgi:hypothetical protein
MLAGKPKICTPSIGSETKSNIYSSSQPSPTLLHDFRIVWQVAQRLSSFLDPWNLQQQHKIKQPQQTSQSPSANANTSV